MYNFYYLISFVKKYSRSFPIYLYIFITIIKMMYTFQKVKKKPKTLVLFYNINKHNFIIFTEAMKLFSLKIPI